MMKYSLLPLAPVVLGLSSCGSNDEIASGTFTDEDGNKGSYEISGDDDSSETVIKTDKGEVRFST